MRVPAKTDLTQIEELRPILDAVSRLHDGVEYGKGGVMGEQLFRTAQIICDHATPARDLELIKAALAYKLQEADKIKPPKQPYTDAEVIALVGEKAGRIAIEFKTEPQFEYDKKAADYDTKKDVFWQNDMAAWARSLSPGAQKILIAEKMANYETSRDNPSAKPLKWHTDYCNLRGHVIEASRAADPALADMAMEVKRTALNGIALRDQLATAKASEQVKG